MIAKSARLVLLAGLLVAASPPAAGEVEITIKFGGGSSKLAKKLVKEVEAVRRRFEDNRTALATVQGPGGAPAYSRQAVVDLVGATERDLDQAIERVKEPKLEGLKAWAKEANERSQRKLAIPPPGEPAGSATPAALSAQPGAAVFAVYRGGPQRATWAKAPGKTPSKGSRKAPPKTSPPPPPEPPKPDPLETTTVGIAQANSILDQVGKVVERLFFLADKNDLEVRLWVGSTPAERVAFKFWPKAGAPGTTQSPAIIKTNGKKDHVLRGLYAYTAALGAGPVTELIASDKPDGSASRDSERLDLVNGSSFFCCRFEEKYCHHVDDEKECRAERH